MVSLEQSPDQPPLSAVSFHRHIAAHVHRYSVFVPLVEGFNGGEASATVKDVVDVFERWVRERGNANLPYFTGLVHGGKDSAGHPTINAVFGWHEATGFKTIREQNAVIEISSHPELHRDFGAEQFDEMMDSLTTALGVAFKQKRIYVMAGQGLLTIFQEDGSRTPTQLD